MSIPVKPVTVWAEIPPIHRHVDSTQLPPAAPTAPVASTQNNSSAVPNWLVAAICLLVITNILSLGLGYLAYHRKLDSINEFTNERQMVYFNRTDLIQTTSQTIINVTEVTEVTDITQVYKSISNETFRFNVKYYGAVGDGSVDDTAAIERAVVDSSAVGGVVYVPAGRYLTVRTLNIPAGVSLVGDGQGSNPRDMSGLKGSVILYRGTSWAVRVLGDLSRIEHLTIYDNGIGGGTALGAIMLDADNGRFIESVTMRSVLLFRFTSGTGLKLYANAGGAISYCSFYDVRVRNAHTGYHLHATGTGGSFTNSHSFYRGAISGGGYAYGLRLEGPGANNNHNFHGLVIEPYESVHGHLYVTGGKSQLNGYDIRIEAVQQAADVSMIYLDEDTYGSMLTGLFSAGLITANRLAHELHISTGKFVGAAASANNVFHNAAFRGVPSGAVHNAIPGWTLSVSPSVTLANVSLDNSNQILPDHQVLRLTVPRGTILTMTCTVCPQPAKSSLFAEAAFGMYIRYVDDVNADVVLKSRIYATFDTSASSVVSSLIHPRNVGWTFTSMNAIVPYIGISNVVIFPNFVFDNSDNIDAALTVEVTLPSFSWGVGLPQVRLYCSSCNHNSLNMFISWKAAIYHSLGE